MKDHLRSQLTLDQICQGESGWKVSVAKTFPERTALRRDPLFFLSENRGSQTDDPPGTGKFCRDLGCSAILPSIIFPSSSNLYRNVSIGICTSIKALSEEDTANALHRFVAGLLFTRFVTVHSVLSNYFLCFFLFLAFLR